jgi:hypothetical protein
MPESINKPKVSIALEDSGNVWIEVDHDSSEVRDRNNSVKTGVGADTGTTRDTRSVVKGTDDARLVNGNGSSTGVDAEESVGNNTADVESVVNVSANAWIVDKGGSAEVDVGKVAGNNIFNVGSVVKDSADAWLVDDNGSSAEVDVEESVENNTADIESVVNVSANAWLLDKGVSTEFDSREVAEDAAVNVEFVL